MIAPYLIKGITLDRPRIDANVKHPLMLITAHALAMGYDKAAKMIQPAHAAGIGLRKADLELGFLTGEEFDGLVCPGKLTYTLFVVFRVAGGLRFR